MMKDKEGKDELSEFITGFLKQAREDLEILIRNNYTIFYNRYSDNEEFLVSDIEYQYTNSSGDTWYFLKSDFKEGISRDKQKKIVEQNRKIRQSMNRY